ncbi:MAG TPA: AAA family ATPase, partial [Trueperaceae bacterium]|nr:AAA family ATPase [Trueperaceae bacterium]
MAQLLAREVELQRLEGYLRKAVAGQGQVCFVSGEAGSGKTTLLQEFSHQAIEAHASLIAVTGTCDAHTGSGDAFLPFREIMEQLTGDLEERTEQVPAKKENARRLKNVVLVAGETLVEMAPDLIGIVIPGASLLAKAGKYVSGKSKWADRLRKQMEESASVAATPTNLDKAQVYEQYVNVLERLSQVAPLLLIIDDLQWADTASLGLLFRLARRIEKLPIMVVGNYRPNDIAVGRDGQRHPLEAMLSEVKRYLGDVVVDLDEARKAGGRAFVDAFLDQEDNFLAEDFRESLVGHTGGHPLFTIELLRDLQERGDLIKNEDGAWIAGARLSWDDLPSRVEGVIEERVARLDADSIHSLRVASVEGPQFTAEIVAKVQPIEVRGLIRLLSERLQRQHRIVTADGLRRIAGQRVSNYRFAHHLMQSYLYRQLDEAEASYLHEDVGLALEALFGAESDQIAVQLARHFDLAGLPEKAVPYLRRAGDQAAARYAN